MPEFPFFKRNKKLADHFTEIFNSVFLMKINNQVPSKFYFPINDEKKSEAKRTQKYPLNIIGESTFRKVLIYFRFFSPVSMI